MEPITQYLLGIAGSPWAYLALAALLVVDGFFPFVPGETFVVSLAVLSASGRGPVLWIVLVVAVAATILGDLIAFRIGRRVGLSRWAWMRHRRIASAFAWAGRGLQNRPALMMLTAKFIPVARVAVTMTAGATRFPIRRYLPLAVTASFIYTAFHVTVGFLAGSWLAANPLLGVLAGIVCVSVLGYGIDLVIRAVGRRMNRGPVTRAVVRPIPALPAD